MPYLHYLLKLSLSLTLTLTHAGPWTQCHVCTDSLSVLESDAETVQPVFYVDVWFTLATC